MTSLVSPSVTSLDARPLERNRQRTRELLTARGRSRDGQGTLFLIGSLAVHVGVLVFFSSLPDAAHAAGERQVEVEIAFEKVDPTPPAPEATPLPLGNLDAPLAAASPEVPATTEPQEVPAPAPELVATVNPYASADSSVFTSGQGALPKTSVTNAKVTSLASSATSFGVENGSTHSSLERQKELSAWHARVQGQLAQLAARNYPRRALSLKQEGTAKVTVRIDAQGRILGADLRSTSGAASLDDAALNALRSVATVAAPPVGTGSTSLTVPVTFRIR